MNNTSLVNHAGNVLEWLSAVSDDELFTALSECDSVIHYAINHEDFSAFEFAYLYKASKNLFDRDSFLKIVIEFNNISTTINCSNDDSYLLAA